MQPANKGQTMTNQHKTPAQNLRAELKAAGYKPSAISVRSRHGSLNITIKDKTIALDKVQEIANGFSNVRRCEASGEILSGGNTFVFVQYGEKVKEEFGMIAEAIGEIAMGAEVSTPSGSIICRPIGAGFNSQFSAQQFGGLCPVDGGKYYNTIARTFSLDQAIEALYRIGQY